MDTHAVEDGVRAAVRAAARDLAIDADAVAAATDAVVCARLGLTDAAVRATLRASTTAHVTLVAGMLGAGTDPRSAVPSPAMLRWAAELVRDGRSIAELLRAYRIGHGEIWAGWQRRLKPHCLDAAVLDVATAQTSAFLFDYVDTVLQPLLDHHAAEVGRSSARVETRRSETIRDLLESERPDIPAASARLRYEVDRWHVGLVLWALPEGTPEDRAHRLHVVADRIDPGALTAPGPGDVLHAWVASARALELAAVPGVVVACGRPGRGLDGFRTTHAEARRALDAARGSGVRSPAVVDFAAIEVLALLRADASAANAFAERMLAPLGPEHLATLRALHDEGMSVSLAARRLGVHANTIGGRVRRILELTGESDPGSLRLRAAVALAPAVP